MALILSLETSTEVCSVAIHEDEKLLATLEVHQPQSHASKLAVLTEQVIQLSGIKSHQLSAVAVSSGPGSYTGLRIGTSTAKGICYALNIPLIAINPLEIMSRQVRNFNFQQTFLCPMIDAMRMEVYCLLMDETHTILHPTEAKIIEPSSFSDILEHRQILFFGNGALKCRDVIRHRNARFIEGVYPKASALGNMALDYFRNKSFADLVNYEPTYLKEFVAKMPRSMFNN
jgi:tRNA threonylcarbamoyladenosine biosynthesis protein TsaB